jgi:hypothetical protein
LERTPRGEKLPKDCPMAKVLLEAKAAALHPDRQTGRNKADERWYLSRPCSVLNSGLYDTTAMTETRM